jgi:hypothetical protein
MYFLNKFRIYAQAGLDHDPPIYASYEAEMIGMLLHVQLLLVEMGSFNFFAWAGLEP